MSKGIIHNVAVAGFAQGTNDHYDTYRPSYPASALVKIAKAIPPPSDPSGLVILEPGCGTGIFSRLPISPPPGYPSFPISTFVGVEPSSGMRETWERALKTKVDPQSLEGKNVKVVDGSFQDFGETGVKEGTADVIVIAQAFHWCPDYEAAMREISRYLTPSGILVLIWNLESNEDGLHQQLRQLYQPFDLGSPQYYKGWWRKCFETETYKEGFEKEEGTNVWSLGMTEDQLVNRLLSKSFLTEGHLDGDNRVRFEKDLRRIIRDGEKEWVDKENGVFSYKYDCDVIIIRRKGTSQV